MTQWQMRRCGITEMSNMIAASEALELHHWMTYVLVTTSKQDPLGLPINCNLIAVLRGWRRQGKPPTSHNYLIGQGSALQKAMALHRKADSGATSLPQQDTSGQGLPWHKCVLCVHSWANLNTAFFNPPPIYYSKTPTTVAWTQPTPRYHTTRTTGDLHLKKKEELKTSWV